MPTDVFTTTGAWTCPDDVTTAWVRCWGSGGAGGGVTADAVGGSVNGGGGQGGYYAEKIAYPVTSGIVYTVTVGAARTGTITGIRDGNDSWFDNATSGVLAKGGAGGGPVSVDGATGAGGTTNTGSIGDTVYVGGSGSDGVKSASHAGAGGGGAGSGSAGGHASGAAGGSGGAGQGGVGAAGRTSVGAGTNGSVCGGGGSGGRTGTANDRPGGPGGAGLVEIEYTVGSATDTVYVAPTAHGTGDGTSVANAHKLSNTADVDWLVGVLTTWRAELEADVTEVGLNQPHTIHTVQPGFEPDYGDKSYVTHIAHGVWARRVCWLSDVGDYTIPTNTGTGAWLSIPGAALPSIPTGDVGESGGNPLRRIHMVAYRTSDNKRADQVPGGAATRSKTVTAKDPAADWDDPTHYTTDADGNQVWAGPTVSKTLTWTVDLPSQIRAVIKGNRPLDPRTGDKTAQQWCVASNPASTFELRDPNGTNTEPFVLDSSGNRRPISQGQVYDPATGAITDHNWTHIGATVFYAGGSCVGFQGFEICNAQALVGHAGVEVARWQSFLDIKLDNTHCCQKRGDNKCDIEFARLECRAVGTEMLQPGRNCQRWHIRDLVYDGLLCIGARFQGIFAAANGMTGDENAHNAGAVRFERMIVERVWDATPPGAGYMNGDGVEAEVKGLAVRDFYCDLTADGGIDTKPSPYWVNWPAVAVFNAWLGRNKRAFRSWNPAQLQGSVAPHVLRDVVIADARQYGLFLVGRAGDHRHVDWHNVDGRPNFINPADRTFVAVSNDGTVSGDMDAVIHQLHDDRSAGDVASGLNTAAERGGTLPPFRARLWTPVTTPGVLTAAIDGVSTDDGAAIAVQAGQPVVMHPLGQPTGTVYDYTLSGKGTVTRSGDDATIELEL